RVRAEAWRRNGGEGGGGGRPGVTSESGCGGADECRRKDAGRRIRAAQAAGRNLPAAGGVSSPMSRAGAAERLAALTAATGEERQALVLAALEDEAPSVREQAIRLATRYVEPEVLGGLVADAVNASRRNGALAALERQGPYAVPYLVKLLSSQAAEPLMFPLQ